ncbi:MAG: dipeptidase [Anaerolineae bacterium]|nr:dipeptidase [Anaerolineae bacterium]
MSPYDYARDHFDDFLEELKAYLRIPSISTLPTHKADMQRAAEWTLERLRELGAEARLIPTPGHPIVYGEWLGAPQAPTVIFYGHYDVQPVDPLSDWASDPFEPIVQDGKLIARGSADDKGPLYTNLAALKAIKATQGTLPVNLKFLIEGEEEISSTHLEAFIKANRDLLRADVAVISDTTIYSLDVPAISTSFRGIYYGELEVRGPAFDLHSGQHGGVIHNPVQALCEIVAALHNPDGSIAVPGFYDRVRPVSPTEKAELAALYTEEQFRAETGAPQSWGEPDYNLRERIVARPTLELNGIVGGFTGEGRKTVIPAKALAKISCRLVPDQDPYEIERLLRSRITELTPPTVTSELRTLGCDYPAIIPTDSPFFRVAVEAYEQGFGRKPIYMRKGGSLPVVGTFTALLNIPVLLMGYGLPTDRVHGPNERFELAMFRRGLVTSIALYEGLGAHKV